ncbi:MAG: diguanylate cyclase [Clostridia bacterium]|nr:diguanylate cyclase [Clostridia bacterium]
MGSLRTKITVMTLLIVVFAVIVVTALSVFFIRRTEHQKSDQLLLLLCDTGERNLEYYFNSVKKSVEKVAEFAEADLDGTDDKHLSRHMEEVEKYFEQMAYKTNGVLTYYYRIDPAVSDLVKGFWYINTDGDGFVEHEVTDITQYDTEDTSSLVWFTVPKHEDTPIWLPPYITDNLDMRVISYNVPIHWKGQFIGVIGIEIDYSTMAEQIDNIKLFNNGYAFLNDSEGNIFYHPRIDVSLLTEETMPKVPDGLIDQNTFITYEFNGVKREAAWLPLSNGMRLNVSVPISETEGDWRRLIFNIIIVAVEVLIAACLFTMIYTNRIVKPLKQLTEAAEQTDRGNYDYVLEYDGNDELGKLTRTFKLLSNHMKEHISSLNQQVYIDALTQVRNKGAFSDYTNDLQKRIDIGDEDLKFAICMFDCDDLKQINDRYGHEKGDIYLKTASRVICNVFQYSPAFRIGGDEFSIILVNEDYNNREALLKRFEKLAYDLNNSAVNQWEQVNVSMGIAEYEPESDVSVADIIRRADKKMYENKSERKKQSRNIIV